MGTITSGIGLVSGINTKEIIDQLMALEARPKTLLQNRVTAINKQKLAYTELSTRLASLKLSATVLKKATTFQQTSAKSTNDDVLTATVTAGAPLGSFQFQVARLVTSQQSVSAGLADPTTKVGTGAVSIAPGDGAVMAPTLLARLNGGAGVRTGSFKITNRAGTSATIDITSLSAVDDVIGAINGANLGITATIGNQGLILTDGSGGTGNLIVEDLGGGLAATDLGIATAPEGIASNTLTGSDISFLGSANLLSDLNDGLGVRTATGNDFRITFADASYVDVDLGSAQTVGQVLAAINTAGAGKVQAEINSATDSIRLTDLTGGGTLSVSALNASNAAADLGLVQSGTSPLSGRTVLGGLNTVLISSLNGGAGLALGSMTITNRAGASASVDLSGSRTVRDMIDAINAAGIGVTASVNIENNGIQLTDTTSESGNLIVVNDPGSTIATQLGLAGSYDTGYTSIQGTNLKRAKLVAGTLTFEMGGGEVYSQTLLSQLNGGKGVQLGAFRITDRSGRSTVVDISGAFTLDDVVKRINTSLDVAVKAEITGDKLTLTDLSGQSVSNLIVTDLGGSTAATDLGLAGSSANPTLVGTTINYLGRSTRLSDLNDAMGVRTANGIADFQIAAADGSTFDIAVSGLTSVGQVVDAINTATGGKVVASIPSNGKGLQLTDSTLGGALTITALNGSKAAADLGLTVPAVGNQINGAAVIASLNTVRIASLRGGAGLNLGTVSFTNRSGASGTIDFSTATSVQDILDRINASGLSLSASIKDAGNGIQIADNSGGIGNLVIADVSSTTAAELGIEGTFAPATTTVRGGNLQRRWVAENTLLSDYNGGRGVSAGKFTITNSKGISAEINVSSTWKTLGNVINSINAAGIGVTASINANGDGLLLTDTAGGPLQMKVEDKTGKTAADLNILGTSPAGATTIDGSFERSITLSPTDTLQTAIDAINAPGFAVSALLVNDGSGWRMSLTARNTGRDGRFLFDAGETVLQTTNVVDAQDAAVIYGAGGARPLVITSSSNQLTNVIKGVTIELHSTSVSPVTLNITQNLDSVTSELQKFADNFNQLSAKLNELMKFDSETQQKGILLGDGTTQQIQERIFRFFSTAVPSAGTYKTLTSVGLKVGKDSQIEFDEDKFRQAYSTDAESVKKLFTLYEKGTGTAPDKKGIAAIIEDMITAMTDPVSGSIARQNQSLDLRTTQFENRMKDIDKLVEIKRARMEKQFRTMESVLSSLQSQQTALNNLSLYTTSTKSKS